MSSKVFHTVFNSTMIVLSALFVGCGSESAESAEAFSAPRGPLGKADSVGSCEGHCGGKSSGTCWCDKQCASFGDCCSDKAAICDLGACLGPNPAGCRVLGCSEGLTCRTLEFEECMPASCTCDASTGTWSCSAECLPPVACLPALQCTTPNPAGCRQTGCSAGQSCVELDFGECIPGACTCDGATGSWNCDGNCLPPVQCVSDPTDASAKVNINQASAAELETLPHLGSWLAQKIVSYRVANGPYYSIWGLAAAGVPAWIIGQIKDLITV